MVEPYLAQSRYYYAAASPTSSIGATSMPGSPTTPAAAAAPPPPPIAAAAAAATYAAPAAAAVPNNGLPEGHRFAQAGAGVQPPPEVNVVDPNEPAQVAQAAAVERRLAVWRWVAGQVMLAGKLGMFLFYFGAHAQGFRLMLLYALAACTFLWQGGWLPRGRGAAAAAAAAAGAAGEADGNGDGAAAADGAGPVPRPRPRMRPRERAESEAAAEAAANPDAAPLSPAAAAAKEAQIVAEEAQEAADAAALAAAPLEAMPTPSLPRLIGTVVFKFFTSLVPGDGAGVEDRDL